MISPRVVDTPAWSFLSERDRAGLFDQVGSGLPGGRVGRADDLADAVLSLAGSEFINATVLHVDGGGRIA